jgi:hypothetical protein
MSFSRTVPEVFSGAALDVAMRGIGMRVGASRLPESRASADLERTLVSVVHEALPNDFRLLGVLLAWLEVHQERVNVPRIGRLIQEAARTPLTKAWWAAIGVWLGREDARWRALSKLYAGPRQDLDDPTVTTLQVQRSGEDARFQGGPMRVHSKLLRSRTADVEKPAVLASRHPLYFLRLLLGPNYRADVWAALDEQPDATPAQVARVVGCAYETARSVAKDWALAQSVERSR